MFEWNDEDGLTDTIWGDLIEKEDHIVPYTKTSGNDALFRYEDYDNILRDDKKDNLTRSYEQNTSDQKDNYPGSTQDCAGQYPAELSGSRFCLDAWPSFKSVESSVRKDGGGNDQGSTSSSIFNDFTHTPNFNRSRDNMLAVSHSREIENDSEHGQTEVDSFLDCDWASITDFEDFDAIFRNGDSSVGHDTASSPRNSDNASAQPLHITEHGECLGKEKCRDDDDDKKALERYGDEKKTRSNHFRSHPAGNNDSSKDNAPKKLLKLRKRDEEKCISDLKKVTSSHPHVKCPSKVLEKLPTASSVFYPAATFPQQTQVGEPAYLGYFPPQQMVMGYGYPAPSFPAIPLVPFVPPTNKNSEHAWVSNVYSRHGKQYNLMQNQQEASSRSLTMTPQEKIEKLRRRQQMQAMLAIKQQEKHFGQQITSSDSILPQLPSPKDLIPVSILKTARTEDIAPISETGMSSEQEDVPNMSVSFDDYSLQETIFTELQETVVKLDQNTRLCMRDSLFRLAKSAMERHGFDDRVPAKNIKTENDFILKDAEYSQRCLGPREAETDTNPIDRAVAHLLFHSAPQQPLSGTRL